MLGVRPSRAGGTRVPPLVARVAGWTTSAVLVLFHVWLLIEHASTGRLFEPVVALRWVLGLGLFAALLGLRAVGVPTLLGRRAAVIWVLVSVLHWHAMSARVPSPTEVGLGLPAEVVVSASTVIAAAILGATLLAGLFAPRRLVPPLGRARRVKSSPARRLPALAHLRTLGCRPPPSFPLIARV